MVRCFFSLSYFVDNYEFSKRTSHPTSVSLTLKYNRIICWSISFFPFICVPNDCLCKIAIWTDDTTLNCSYDQASDLSQQAEIGLSFNLILKIKVVERYFHFSSANFWFWSLKIWYLKLSIQAQTLAAAIQN